MHKSFRVPTVSCSACNGALVATISTRAPVLEVKCGSCGLPVEFEMMGAHVRDEVQARARILARNVARSLVEVRRTVPKNREELGRVVRNPRHPFTAALLTGVVLILMEMSGFGIFLVVSWILSNLILNPLGWFVIPTVVAIFLAYRRVFARESFERIRGRLTELQERYDRNEISEQEYNGYRERILAEAFDAAALEGALERGDFDSSWIRRIRETSNKVKVEWIWDNEHVSALKQAIDDSVIALYIYSGWVSIDVIQVVASAIGRALDRGASVYVGYGWEAPSGKRAPSQRELLALKRLEEVSIPSAHRGSLFIRRFPNHSKLLVCDQQYAICGSANWLSNLGYRNREVSVRIFDQALVAELVAEAASDFDLAQG